MFKSTNNFDQEMTHEGIFLVDALHKDVQPLADRPMRRARAANMPVDRRITPVYWQRPYEKVMDDFYRTTN